MLQIWGSLREKFGKPVNKAKFVVPVDEYAVTTVGQKYFGDKETSVKFGGHPYVVEKKRRAVETPSGLHIHYIVANPNIQQETLTLRGNKVIDGLSPSEMDDLSFVGHVKTALRNATSSGTWIIPLICLALGLFIGFTVAQNLPAISQAISPTPTPPVMP